MIPQNYDAAIFHIIIIIMNEIKFYLADNINSAYLVSAAKCTPSKSNEFHLLSCACSFIPSQRILSSFSFHVDNLYGAIKVSVW